MLAFLLPLPPAHPLTSSKDYFLPSAKKRAGQLQSNATGTVLQQVSTDLSSSSIKPLATANSSNPRTIVSGKLADIPFDMGNFELRFGR